MDAILEKMNLEANAIPTHLCGQIQCTHIVAMHLKYTAQDNEEWGTSSRQSQFESVAGLRQYQDTIVVYRNEHDNGSLVQDDDVLDVDTLNMDECQAIFQRAGISLIPMEDLCGRHYLVNEAFESACGLTRIDDKPKPQPFERLKL